MRLYWRRCRPNQVWQRDVGSRATFSQYYWTSHYFGLWMHRREREKNDEAGLSYLWLQRERERERKRERERAGMDAGRANWNENEQNAKFRARSFSHPYQMGEELRKTLTLARLFICAQNNGYALLFVWKPWDTLIYRAIIPLCWQRMQYTG